VPHTLTVHRFEPADPRLKRNVLHDSRSERYMFLPRDAKPKKLNTTWDSGTGPLNQGEVGSCTGNATAQWLNTNYANPFRERDYKKGPYLGQPDALEIYGLATRLDRVKGVYPPNDTGSSGLCVAKAGIKLGYLGAYKHTMSFSSAQAAIEKTPAIQGTVWTNSMFKPRNGLVKVGKLVDSNIAGGHEYLFCGIDWDEEVHIYRNSWGDVDEWPGCKPGGYFAIGFKDVQALLAMQGDVTVLIGK
jgi:hypothetical protein